MDIETLEETLDELLPGGYAIETDKHGQIVIFTGLTEDEDGELILLDSEEDEDIDHEELDDEELDDDD